MAAAETLAPNTASTWQRWWRGFVAFCEAMDTSVGEIQDSRIARLEVEVRQLKVRLAPREVEQGIAAE